MFRLLCVVLLALSLTGPGYGYEIHVAPSCLSTSASTTADQSASARVFSETTTV